MQGWMECQFGMGWLSKLSQTGPFCLSWLYRTYYAASLVASKPLLLFWRLIHLCGLRVAKKYQGKPNFYQSEGHVLLSRELLPVACW